MDMKLILEGEIPSNKNSFVAVLNRAIITALRAMASGRIHDKSQTNSVIKELNRFVKVTHTRKYKEWFEDARAQLLRQVEHETLFDKVHIEYILYFNRRGIAGGDLSNKLQSIEDVLSSCGIIDDDNYECIVSFAVKGIYKKNAPGAEIFIKSI